MITLFIAMLMLFLSSLMVLAALRMSASNLTAVANVQARMAAVAAAETVLMRLYNDDHILSGARDPHVEQVDMNSDGNDDFEVVVSVPRCVRALPIDDEFVDLGSQEGAVTDTLWQTTWVLEGAARDAISGASVSVSHGISYLLDTAEKSAACEDASAVGRRPVRKRMMYWRINYG